MRVSSRLKAIAEMVRDEEKIIDIGCDHALLDIYLIENKSKLKIIASDIHEKALETAKKNVEKHKLDKKIKLRLGDGLSVVKSGEVETIIMSGMGYQTIMKILKNGNLEDIHSIIIQSNTDVVKLRKSIIKLGFLIEEEALVKDKNIIYTVIRFERGKDKYSYEEIYFGPMILRNKDDLFYEYYNKKLLKYENLLLQLPSYEIKSRLHHKKLIKIIKKEVSTEE